MLYTLDSLPKDILIYYVLPMLGSMSHVMIFAQLSMKYNRMVNGSHSFWMRLCKEHGIQSTDPDVPPKEQLRLYLEIDKPLRSLHAHVARVIGPVAFSKLPVYDTKDNIGWTGYLDFIHAGDMTAPVMKGIDAVRRPFIVLRYENRETGKVGVATVFHRYTDGESWVNGTCYRELFPDRVMRPIYIEYMDRLLRREPCGHLEWNNGEEIDKVRTLPDGRSIVELV